MVLRASFYCNGQLWPGILSAAWILTALVTNPTVIAAQELFKCDFEYDMCGIQQSGSDWVRKSGATSSMDAGPEGGYGQSRFYFFPDNLKKQQASEFALPDFSSSGVACIQFGYTAHGTKLGKLILYAQKGSQTATRKEIWQNLDLSSKDWVLERLPYSMESGEQIIFRAISGGTGEEMAVDSISISRGTCSETCHDTQWKVERNSLSPGGIFWANLNTEDLCKDECVLIPHCLAVDLLKEGSRVLCYHHIKTFSLREVIKVQGASQHTITRRCGVESTSIPASPPASECRPIWAKRSFFYSLGGVHRPEVHSASACRDACLQERSCIAADIQWAGNVLDDSLICRLHSDRTKLLVPLLMANTEQWELVERCSMIDVGVTRTITHKPLENADGCLVQWEERRNTHYVGGAYYTGPSNEVLMPRTCLAECLTDPRCIAVDINFGRSPMECWLYVAIANRSKSYSTANIRHYYLTKRCVHDKAVPLPIVEEEDDGSGSSGGGEGSGRGVMDDPDMPKLLKPEVCATLNWERQPNFYSLGGTKSTSNTLEQCLDSCENNAKCQGVDYHDQEGCIVHEDAADFYYVLSGPGWIQYQLISDCGKIPSKERPGKVEIKPECTKGVVQKEYLRSSSGAVFYGKVSSVWQCLDLCIHSKKCMGAEIRRVDRGLSCFFHYSGGNFDVLLSSDHAVLYVLSKQCIRLRDSDMGLSPKTTQAPAIPYIVDLDGDDTNIEAEATFCEEVTCYLFMRAKLKWKEAQTECEMKHGKLVSIKSDAIQKLIEKELRIYKITDPMWIGASIINEIAFTNQSVSLWRVVQGTGSCSREEELGKELLNRAVTSQGCFMEAKDAKEKEFLFTAVIPPKTLTPATCLEECSKQGHSYAGVRDGNVCTCGSSFGMYGPASDCVELCEGDYSQYCGGIGAHAVFKASGIRKDFSMWNYNEPKNTSSGHWCGALDMFELDIYKKLASRPCNEDQKFICQLRECGSGQNYVTVSWGFCVYFGDNEVTWHQARARCLSMNGDLLILDSEEKRREIQLAVTAALPSMTKRYVWIGLFSRIYYWDDLSGGSELCYSNFGQGEPVFQKNCLYLDPSRSFQWFSGVCEDEKHDFICEIDTSKGELPLLYPSPPIKQRPGGDAVQPPPRQKPAEDRLIAAASTDEEDEGGSGGGSQGLSALEVALIAAIGVVAVALLVGGTMYGVSRQRKRTSAQQQQQGDAEMRSPPDRGPAEPVTSESRTASRQASSVSAAHSEHQPDTHSAGSPSLKQSRESQSLRLDGAPGSGLDSPSGGAPVSGSASSVGASGGSTKGSTKGD